MFSWEGKIQVLKSVKTQLVWCFDTTSLMVTLPLDDIWVSYVQLQFRNTVVYGNSTFVLMSGYIRKDSNPLSSRII